MNPASQGPRRIATIDELEQLANSEVGVSPWIEITQEQIDAFAKLTGDSQWIHVDSERAAAESPFGATIAHGYLTLSMLSQMAHEAVDLDLGAKLRVNYGLNRLRFVAPVLVGMRIRGRFVLAGYREVDGGVEVMWSVTVEAENQDKPRLVAEWLVRAYR